jgi:hypothetical protein
MTTGHDDERQDLHRPIDAEPLAALGPPTVATFSARSAVVDVSSRRCIFAVKRL